MKIVPPDDATLDAIVIDGVGIDGQAGRVELAPFNTRVTRSLDIDAIADHTNDDVALFEDRQIALLYEDRELHLRDVESAHQQIRTQGGDGGFHVDRVGSGQGGPAEDDVGEDAGVVGMLESDAAPARLEAARLGERGVEVLPGAGVVVRVGLDTDRGEGRALHPHLALYVEAGQAGHLEGRS